MLRDLIIDDDDDVPPPAPSRAGSLLFQQVARLEIVRCSPEPDFAVYQDEPKPQ